MRSRSSLKVEVHLIERIYADHSNRLKALANEARRGVVNTKTHPLLAIGEQGVQA
jgi:hypothetical protein